MVADSNRRMRENRLSGGVGGVTGAIPLPRPDRQSGFVEQLPGLMGCLATRIDRRRQACSLT